MKGKMGNRGARNCSPISLFFFYLLKNGHKERRGAFKIKKFRTGPKNFLLFDNGLATCYSNGSMIDGKETEKWRGNRNPTIQKYLRRLF